MNHNKSRRLSLFSGMAILMASILACNMASVARSGSTATDVPASTSTGAPTNPTDTPTLNDTATVASTSTEATTSTPIVQVILPASATPTLKPTVTLTPTITLTPTATVMLPGTITGTVYNNGINGGLKYNPKVSKEAAGISVMANTGDCSSPGALLATDITDAKGGLFFSLNPGTYCISFAAPTSHQTGAKTVKVTNGGSVKNINFFYYQ